MGHFMDLSTTAKRSLAENRQAHEVRLTLLLKNIRGGNLGHLTWHSILQGFNHGLITGFDL